MNLETKMSQNQLAVAILQVSTQKMLNFFKMPQFFLNVTNVLKNSGIGLESI